MDQNGIKEHISALLLAAREQGWNGLSTTALTKFLYLLDYYSSVRSEHYSLLIDDWRFYHFGPYSSQVESAVSSMEKSGLLVATDLEDPSSEESYGRIFQLAEYQRPTRLRDLELPEKVPFRLETALYRFRYKLPELLNHVYFETEPMVNAKPGEILSFPGPEAVAKTEDVHLFKMQIEKSKTEKVKALLSSRAEKLRRSEKAASRRPSAIYDQHFHDFMDSITPIDSEGHEQLSASATLDLYKPQ